MKNILTLSLLILGLTSVVNATEPQENCEMGGIVEKTSCSLKSDEASLKITVQYPKSLYCKMQLVVDLPSVTPETLMKLADHLFVELEDSSIGRILKLKPEINRAEGVVEYELGVNTLFMAQVTVSTIYGNSLNSTIKSVFGQDVNLTAVPVNCIN